MSIVFEDRVSAYPNRYLITDENGNSSYVVLERADEPVKVGTPLNAETFNGVMADKAPAGYGLGTSGVWVNDLNQATKSGFYCWTSGALNSPFNHGSMLVLYRDGGNSKRVTQIAFDPIMSNSGEIAVRHCTDVSSDKWTEWGTINPSMRLDTEYRTTERWIGSTVYTKLINFGNLPNNSFKNVGTGVHASKIIRSEIMATNNTNNIHLPYFLADGTLAVKNLFNTTNVQITTTMDYSGYTAYVRIWYTKD